MGSKTGFLFADPSFVEGVGRLADLTGALNQYNISSNPQAADRRATRADWGAVGDDLRAAGRQVRGEQRRKAKKR